MEKKIIYGSKKERVDTPLKTINCIAIIFRKFVNPKILHIFNKTLVLSIICNKCDNNTDIIFRRKQ